MAAFDPKATVDIASQRGRWCLLFGSESVATLGYKPLLEEIILQNKPHRPIYP